MRNSGSLAALSKFMPNSTVIWCHLVVVIGSNLNIVGDNSESRGNRIASMIPEMYQLVGQIQKFIWENTEDQGLTLHLFSF